MTKASLTSATKAAKPANSHKTVKVAHRGRHLAHDDRDITASIAAKKSKTKTAESSTGWTLFRR